MKKLLTLLIATVLSVACALGAAGCNKGSGNKLSVYVPDGAPALSVVSLAESDAFNVKVIAANTVNAYIGGENPMADFAVVPVNAAVKLLGNGEKYKLLGTVTHGNLFLLKKQGGEDVSAASDLQKLKGKTVGIINLANVPGLTFKVILQDNGIEYNELKDGAATDGGKVNLKNIDEQEVLPSNTACDYFVVSEPAASTKIAATQGKLSAAGSLQTLYGGQTGYPQAVAVVKKEIVQNNVQAVNDFILSFNNSKNWILSEQTSPEQIEAAINKITEGDLQHTFNAGNLSKSVIANCGINFVAAADCKIELNAYMQKLNAVSGNVWGTASDEFFYL